MKQILSLALNFAAVSGVALAIGGCQGIQTRNDVNQSNQANQANQTPTHPNHPTAVNTPAPQPQATPAPAIPSTPANPAGNAPVAPAAPAFLSKELPKVGVILGAGGMKAYAHLGVLREFQRARIPVQAVVGMEWGAVMGGLFASQGQVNDAEWKAFKLRGDELPSHGFLSSKIKPASVGSLKGFFSDTFANATMDRAKIPFACIGYSSKTDRLSILEHGGFRDAMNRCVPYPPMFTETNAIYAEPFAINEAAAWLRAHGANVVVLVNVLGQGEIFQANIVGEQASENLLWNEVRRSMLSTKAPVVNWVINVNTSGHPITDADGRRAIMDQGAKSANDVVNKMATQYGF